MNAIIPLSEVVPEEELRVETPTAPVADDELLWSHVHLDTHEVLKDPLYEIVLLTAEAIEALPACYRSGLLVRSGVPKELAETREPIWQSLAIEARGLEWWDCQIDKKLNSLITGLLRDKKGEHDV